MIGEMPDVEDLPTPAAPDESNCPFYGYSWLQAGIPFTLIASGGNQCALIIDRHAPCYLKFYGVDVDWRACRRVAEIRFDLVGKERT